MVLVVEVNIITGKKNFEPGEIISFIKLISLTWFMFHFEWEIFQKKKQEQTNIFIFQFTNKYIHILFYKKRK